MRKQNATDTNAAQGLSVCGEFSLDSRPVLPDVELYKFALSQDRAMISLDKHLRVFALLGWQPDAKTLKVNMHTFDIALYGIFYK